MLPTKSGYKDQDIEETLDIYFYRPIGLRLAYAAKFLGLSPNAVTLLSGVVGVAGGHFLYYPAMRFTLVGVLLLILSDALDSADGQLARITNQRSDLGRMLDGLAGNLVFLSIYVHLCLRYIAQGSQWNVVVLAVAAALCHSFQSALADYFRNGYLYFVRGPSAGELHTSAEIRLQYEKLSWRSRPFRKLVVVLYLSHARQQGWMARRFTQLRLETGARFGIQVPEQLKDEYRILSKPLVKYYNILTINTRMMALFAAVILERPYLYFLFELTVLNLIFIYVIMRQERISGLLLEQITTRGGK